MNISSKLINLSTGFSSPSISCFTKFRFNGLVDIKQIRRRNLLSLIGEGTRAAFASRVGTDPAYISQILSQKTKADVGDKLARAIEDAYRLPFGWMDHDHSQAETVSPHNEMAEAWAYLLPQERAALEAEIKQRAAHNRAVGEMIAGQAKPVPSASGGFWLKDRLPENEPNDFTRLHVRNMRAKVDRRKENLSVEMDRRKSATDRRSKE